MTQDKLILKHLCAGNAITSLDALMKFQCIRLAARIYDLREKGVKIHSGWVHTKSDKRVKQYYM